MFIFGIFCKKKNLVFLEFNFDYNWGEAAAPNFINNTNNALCTLYDGQKLTAERDQYLCQLISTL